MLNISHILSHLSECERSQHTCLEVDKMWSKDKSY